MDSDTRVELVNRMDRAAAAMDFVRVVALARLNWRLIDDELLAVTANRAAAAQQAAAQQAAFAQQSQLAAQRSALQTERTNWVVGQAAIAIGDNPSKYMVSSTPSFGGAAADPAANPALQIFATVHQVLARTAMLQGAPDPQVAPGIAARAVDILQGKVSSAEAMKLFGDAVPPEQRALLGMVSKIPLLGDKLIGPLVRSAAANAAPLNHLYRLVPDAVLPGQVVPDAGAVGVAPAPPAVGFDAPLVDTLLAQAMAADAAHADALYLAALDAAGKTPKIDDDIAVLAQLARAAGDQAPSEALVRRAEALISEMAPRVERRDDVAGLLAWLAFAAVARGLASELGPRLLKSCQAVLQSAGLGAPASVRLAGATAELLVRAGKPDKAALLVEVLEKRVTDSGLRKELAEIRARITRSAP